MATASHATTRQLVQGVADFAEHAKRQHARHQAAERRIPLEAPGVSTVKGNTDYLQGYTHALANVVEVLRVNRDFSAYERMLSGYADRAEREADRHSPPAATGPCDLEHPCGPNGACDVHLNGGRGGAG